MNPHFHTDFSISDSLIFVRKSVLIYETIINCVKNPHIYTIQDWEKLNESKKFFARKFDINKDPDVIFKIYNQLKID